MTDNTTMMIDELTRQGNTFLVYEMDGKFIAECQKDSELICQGSGVNTKKAVIDMYINFAKKGLNHAII